MSQFKINAANAQYPLDAFATITVASTVGFVVGEAVYQGVSLAAATASAKISQVVSATKLKVKGVKGIFADAVAVKSASVVAGSVQAASGFQYGYSRTRDVAGTPTVKLFGQVSADDRGILQRTREDAEYEVVVAAQRAVSKMQNTDASVGPSLVYTIPAVGSYADGAVMRFTITSNEALSFTGAPRVAIVTLGSAETVYATVNAELSDSMMMVFDYVVDETTTTAGQIVSAAYDANGAVITDIGGGAVVPNFNAVVTGILIA